MSPRARGGYRPGRDRREVIQAVLGVLAVVLVAVALVWVFAPNTDEVDPTTPPFTLPPELTTTTVPGGAVTTVPTTATTAPPG